MDLQQAKERFSKIAEKTGILSRTEQKAGPSQDERDELWDITRVFAERIYKLEDAALTKIDLMNGHPIIEPPSIKRLATTISLLFL